MKRLFGIALICSFSMTITAQPEGTGKARPSDYYYQIPDYPSEYTEHNVVARVLDGLGFRFYWASEGLSQDELTYQPSEGARTTAETIDHIYDLSLNILNAVKSRPSRSTDRRELSDLEKREVVLENIKTASDLLKAVSPKAMEEMQVIFETPDRTFEYPFWNMLNGPVSDAIYHTGQIVSFRRSAGNPINPNISVLRGRIR